MKINLGIMKNFDQELKSINWRPALILTSRSKSKISKPSTPRVPQQNSKVSIGTTYTTFDEKQDEFDRPTQAASSVYEHLSVTERALMDRPSMVSRKSSEHSMSYDRSTRVPSSLSHASSHQANTHLSIDDKDKHQEDDEDFALSRLEFYHVQLADTDDNIQRFCDDIDLYYFFVSNFSLRSNSNVLAWVACLLLLLLLFVSLFLQYILSIFGPFYGILSLLIFPLSPYTAISSAYYGIATHSPQTIRNSCVFLVISFTNATISFFSVVFGTSGLHALKITLAQILLITICILVLRLYVVHVDFQLDLEDIEEHLRICKEENKQTKFKFVEDGRFTMHKDSNIQDSASPSTTGTHKANEAKTKALMFKRLTLDAEDPGSSLGQDENKSRTRRVTTSSI